MWVRTLLVVSALAILSPRIEGSNSTTTTPASHVRTIRGGLATNSTTPEDSTPAENEPQSSANTNEDDEQVSQYNHHEGDAENNLEGGNKFSPSTELGPIDDHNYEPPTRHIHFHQHHVGAGASMARHPSPAQSPGLSHYRAGPLPSHHHALTYHPVQHSEHPIKFEQDDDEGSQVQGEAAGHGHVEQGEAPGLTLSHGGIAGLQHYSVHEEHDMPHSHQALHSAIAATHPSPSEGAGENVGVGVGLGGGLDGHLHEDFGGQYPSLGPVPYDNPKVIPPASGTLSYSHTPKDIHHPKPSVWKHALRVLAGLAPLALLVAAIQPSVLIVDPRAGTRHRSAETQSGSAVQQCEQRAVCEMAKSAGPQALKALLEGSPAFYQGSGLRSASDAADSNECSRFVCDQYAARSATIPIVTPASAAAPQQTTQVTPPGAIVVSDSVSSSPATRLVPKERKRKKFVVRKSPSIAQ